GITRGMRERGNARSRPGRCVRTRGPDTPGCRPLRLRAAGAREEEAGNQGGGEQECRCSHFLRPLLTTRFTFAPPGSTAPNFGFCASTTPFLTSLLKARRTFPTTQWPRARIRFAAASVVGRS